MKYIITLFAALALLVFPAAHAGTTVNYTKEALVKFISESKDNKADKDLAKQIVDAAFRSGDKYSVAPLLILSFIRAESNFNPKAKNRSGASGLMQVIPYWHRDKIKGRNIFNVSVAVDVGTPVLQEYLLDHRDNLKRAMRKYSGGAGGKYSGKIQAFHGELRQVVVAYQFQKERNIISPKYGDVRSWHASADRAHTDYPVQQALALAPVQPTRPRDPRDYASIMAVYELAANSN